MAETKERRKMVYSDEELALIKSVFADGEDRLRLVQKLMLFTELSSGEIESSKLFLREDVVKLLSKVFNPTVSHEVPFGQNIDLWMTIDFKDKAIAESLIAIDARKKLITYLKQGIMRLSSPELNPAVKVSSFELTGDESSEDDLSTLMARNTLIGHVDIMINSLIALAGQKEESVEETMAKLAKNSAK